MLGKAVPEGTQADLHVGHYDHVPLLAPVVEESDQVHATTVHEQVQAAVDRHVSHGDDHDVDDHQPEIVEIEANAGGIVRELPTESHGLNPEADSFTARDSNLVHHGRLYPDLGEDWAHVQQVQAGGVGHEVPVSADMWNKCNAGSTIVESHKGRVDSEPLLPFHMTEDIPAVLGLAPKQVLKVNQLRDMSVRMPSGVFTDKALPAPAHVLKKNNLFTGEYYVALHNVAAAPGLRADGSSYPAFTPNHIGARVTLPT